MGLFSAGLTFLQPWALFIGAPAIGLLVYAYRQHGRGDRRVVSSLIILKTLKSTSSARKEFRPPLRFLMELIILLLLIVGAAGLAKQQSGERTAVIIDNSLSVSASLVGTNRADRGVTVLDELKGAANSYLNSLKSDSQITLFATTPYLRRINEDPISPGQAVQRLSEFQFAFGSDNLEAHLKQVLEDSKYERTAVLTDRPYRAGKSNSLQGSLKKLDVITVGGQPGAGSQGKSFLENVRIGNIRFTSVSGESKSRQLEVQLDAYTLNDVSVELIIELFRLRNGTPTYEPLRTERVQLSPGTSRVVSFDNMPPQGAYRARLQISQADVARNRISYDDTARIALTSESYSAQVVSLLPLRKLGLEQMKLLQFRRLSPEQYLEQASAQGSRGGEDASLGVQVFHRFVPKQLPAGNLLIVLPPAQNGIFQVQPAVKRAEVTRWLESHPVTSYLNLPVLSLPSLTPLVVPEWAKEFLATTRGTAGFIGERESGRVVVLGFEMFPFEGKKSPLLSVLTLNIFKWLTTLSGQNAGYLLVGKSIPIDDPDTLPVPYGDAGAQEVRLAAGEDKMLVDQPGFLTSGASGVSQIEAVNYFQTLESDLRDSPPLKVVAADRRVSDRSVNAAPYASEIALLVLVLLGLDLLLLSRRFYTKRRSAAVR